MGIFAEYVWIDGAKPTAKLRSKTKVLASSSGLLEYPVDLDKVPVWGFDGSSTGQASGDSSDCILKPVRVISDPIRGFPHVLIMCEVLDATGNPGLNNHRDALEKLGSKCNLEEPLFGIEQEYTFFKGSTPLGWPERGYPAPQGPFYCGIGADEVFGREIVEEHMQACLTAGLNISGVNAEVMPGQWEFQIGPSNPVEVSDHLWLARYLLYRLAEKYEVNVKLDSKPIAGDWNGAGAHTNFSTKDMREGNGPINGIDFCKIACEKIGDDFKENGFPKVYGHNYKQRLTGAHETCSHEEFNYGVGDRTASMRIPLHVDSNGCGYIEDRRPCANIDPYQVCHYMINTVCVV